MEIRKCKNKKCQRTLPKGYKHNYCENCRNERIKQIKDAGKAIAGVAAFVGGTALTILTKGKFNTKE
ncbi:hypothetical protein [Acetivibrio mesophilus]|jgi:hypothetical protein|uniref:Uncharacterized protein n=1 Tax=Acetivibrio mesophilus TaxID=2487273 RepID=A0A4Q0I844_9FIRM|nr:hypothetical protein [Acetivibrio mesophilus]ODM26393.1 hypothetical protein A7W90_09250 [Clostridium sp. Bc-iso-3]RXE60548.1 hypothetical protein EFD62_01010 [Acetivibrio mesophilus]HOA80650.1 hypothetical protein [Defluviitaleaceae bacterium]